MNRLLGENIGHFFIKEIRNTLSDEGFTYIKNMGHDLGILQVESEITSLE